MKREIVKYVSECDTCRRVKADHLRPARNLQPLSIPKWKWKNICMNLIVGLPHTSREYNSIWVIVDCLTKSAHLCHTRFLRPKPDAHRMYAQDQIVIHTVRM
jgi:hypothetical protein